MIALLLLILVITLSINYLYKYNRKYKDVNRIPGPPSLPILGNILDLGNNSRSYLENLLNFTSKYGPIYKLWLGPFSASVVISGPKYVEKILVSEAVINKGRLYKLFDMLFGDGFALASGERWRTSRKTIAPIFNAINVEKYVPIFNENANKLIDSLKSVDLENYERVNHLITSCTLDGICKILISSTFDKESKQKFLDNFRKQLEAIYSRLFSIFRKFDIIFKLTNDYKRLKKDAEEGNKLVEDIIARERKQRQEKGITETRETFLGFVLDRCDNDQSYTLKNVQDDLNAVIGAGFETVSTTLNFCIYKLSKQPNVQIKLLEEIEGILGTDDLCANIASEDIYKMRYLECVLKETLRLYTPLPMIERTILNDINLDGMHIPKGTSFLIFLLGVHRNKDQYPEPDKFNPERFLLENCNTEIPCSFVPFSVGLRNCIGQKFAMAEASIILCKMIRNFEIVAVPEHTPILTLDVSLKSLNGLPVLLKPRRS